MIDADAVLFDLDGVLVDSRVAFARSVNAALVAHGLPPRPEEALHEYLGPRLHATFSALTEDRSMVRSCVDAYRARYRAHAVGETAVFAGIPELLVSLSRHVPLAVATSKPRALAEPLLSSLGLRAFFAAVVGPELDAVDERKSETIARALRELPAKARATMVGDRKHDIAAAHELGVPAIGVLWGIGSRRELRAAGADALAGTPAELETLLLHWPAA